MQAPPSFPSSLIPCLWYRNAQHMIEWLSRVFGLSVKMVVPDGQGGVAHAELTHAGGMIMLGSVKAADANPYAAVMVMPDEVAGRQTQTIYLVVPDADAVHDRAVASGAAIVIPIKDEDYGGRGFTCRDIEGHVWSVGTYDPWKSV
ncbi:MAG: VOC family protein [Pirellulales bacterium]